MSKVEKRGPMDQYEDIRPGTGACGTTSNRGSSSSEGDYDIVWDSVRFGKHLNTLTKSLKRESCSSENIYTEIDRVSHVDIPQKLANGHISTQTNLFPPMDEFGLKIIGEKNSLGRTRSKSQ